MVESVTTPHTRVHKFRDCREVLYPKQKKQDAPAKDPETDVAEEYEQVPRQRLNEDKSERKRAAPLPLKVDGQLVFPNEKDMHQPTSSLASPLFSLLATAQQI